VANSRTRRLHLSQLSLQDVGYGATHIDFAGASRVRFGVEGMTCGSCPLRIEESLLKKPGVFKVTANMATDDVQVAWAPAALGVVWVGRGVLLVGSSGVCVGLVWRGGKECGLPVTSATTVDAL